MCSSHLILGSMALMNVFFPHVGDTSIDDSMFPVDKVLLVGSNMTVCCKITDEADIVDSIQFNGTNYPAIQLGSSNVGGVRLFNMNKSESSGDNIVCNTNAGDYMAGTVVFVGCE